MADVGSNEDLTGLVNLLHGMVMEGADPDAAVIENKEGSNSTPTTQSSHSQILELVKKLQHAQADSPEILAALKSPELRALAALAAQTQAPKKAPASAPAPSLDDVMDDDDNYPKIGPGYSDDISVVSDLTTPTVMTRQNVMDEELYKDVHGGPGSLPPMHIGVGASQPSRPVGGVRGGHHPKQKNLVSSVKPNAATRRAIAKTGGAAAQRRMNYQQAMAKLQSSEYGSPKGSKASKNYMENFSPKKAKSGIFAPLSPTPKPSELPSMVEQGKVKARQQSRTKSVVKEKKGKKLALSAQEEDDFELDYDPMAPKYDQAQSSAASSSSGGKKKKEKPAPVNKDIEWSGDTGGWPAFEGNSNPGENLFVDNDGFFPSSEVFQPSSRGPSRTTSKVRRDSDAKPRKPRKEGERKDKDRSKRKNSRKVSLTM